MKPRSTPNSPWASSATAARWSPRMYLGRGVTAEPAFQQAGGVMTRPSAILTMASGNEAMRLLPCLGTVRRAGQWSTVQSTQRIRERSYALPNPDPQARDRSALCARAGCEGGSTGGDVCSSRSRTWLSAVRETPRSTTTTTTTRHVPGHSRSHRRTCHRYATPLHSFECMCDQLSTSSVRQNANAATWWAVEPRRSRGG